MSLAHLLILALKHLALNVVSNCTAMTIEYSTRFGSLLSTDLTLWLISTIIGNYTCYHGISLLSKDFPQKLSLSIINITYSSMPKIKNVETLRIIGKWYYVYIGEPFSLGSIVKTLEKYDDLRAYFAFLILKYEYLKFIGKRIPLALSPCNRFIMNYSNVDFKDAVSYALMSVNTPLKGGNLKFAINLASSYLAYALYYDRKDIPFGKKLLKMVIEGSCSPREALIALLCKLSGGELWLCYASVKEYLALTR